MSSTSSFPLRALIYVAALLIGPLLQGQSIFSNAINGSIPGNVNPYTAGQIVDPHISVSGIGRGSNVGGVGGTDQYMANSWPLLALDPNSYFSFILNPNPGYRINFTSFVYSAQASIVGGPTVFTVRSSLDGFTSNLGVGILVGGGSINLSGAAFQNISSSIEFRIYAWVAGASSGTYSINDFSFNAAVVLPIELIDFQARSTDAGTATLSFSTATERDNDYFLVERSQDGVHFAPIGRVKGAGNSTTRQDYRYIDEQPKRGRNFYRLQQVDLNGQFSYSPVSAVTIDQGGSFRLSPQPVLDELRITLEEAVATDSQWQIFDFTGRLLQSGRLAAEGGSFYISMATFKEGSYVLRLISGQSVRTQLFQKG